MYVAETYLDLDILINGGMDTLLLVLIGRFIHLPVRPFRIMAGALLGEIPVLMACYSAPLWTTLIKWVIPFLMVAAAFPTKRWKNYLKALVGFWILSAGLGGFVYALWGWVNFDDGFGGEQLTLALGNLWIIPLAAGVWWLLQFLWQRWQERTGILEQNVFDLEISFGSQEHEAVRIKALMDTGNHLRDPLTGHPVILMEEEVAVSAMPDNVRAFLSIPWQESQDPWPLIWKTDPSLVKQIVFIPYKTVDRQSWLVGIRPERVTCYDKRDSRIIRATVALVNQVLSSEGEYQALLHPEHVQKGGDG